MEDRKCAMSTAFATRTQLRPEQLVAAKKVERQETVVVVKAVEVSPLLLAVNGIVGCIDIDGNLFRRLFVGFDEEFDEGFRAGGNFFVGDSIFESGKRGGTAEGLFFVGGLFDGDEQCEIMSELGMVINIFVAQSDGIDSLSEKITLLVGDVSGIAGIVNESSDGFGEFEFLVGLLEEEGSTGIRGELFGSELDGEGWVQQSLVARLGKIG